ncbi:MAG: cytochrome c oxidase accessory protein CcoG [Gemmatimonadales bacterium]|nr:cytochrome c oxidase accessory protein CcoG [Gemmatimonadales bacterium]
MTLPAAAPAQATERVLATLNVDGSRRWLRPRWQPGRLASARRVVAYVLIALFLAIPHLRWNGKPWMLLDPRSRQATLFGATFLPTETLLLLLLVLSVFIGIFLFTALFGRVWCGWGCPQTVWMEFLFRPVERLLEGGPAGARKLDALGSRGHLQPRRLAKYAVYALFAVVLGNTFLMYFFGADDIFRWMGQSPREHGMPFAVMAITSALVFFDFTYFREQTCLVACPYGRIQSALLDRSSLIVAYDAARGEPRGRGRAREGLGACVDCSACTQVCPTGIDIRDGLQLECVHCTQCIDACDAVMDRLGQPRGLVRYASLDGLAGKPARLVRPRTVLYPLAFTIAFGLFLYNLDRRVDAQVTVLRGAGAAPFIEQAGGLVSNQLRIKLENRAAVARRFTIALAEPGGVQLIAPVNPVVVEPRGHATSTIFVLAPATTFAGGRRPITLRVTDGAGFDQTTPFALLGPE